MITLGCRVLVEQRSPRRRVADAGHQLLGRDAGYSRGERRGVMAEVVQAQFSGAPAEALASRHAFDTDAGRTPSPMTTGQRRRGSGR